MNEALKDITAERYAAGMSFAAYLDYIATPENLRREATDGGKRIDRSDQMRRSYEAVQLSEHQVETLRWLASQPGGAAKVLAISEEWSSDCRRDVPVIARVAEAAGLELRVFTRDGERFSSAHEPSAAESPNADLMGRFLNHKRGEIWQSIPVIAFYRADLTYLYHYIEYPAIYEKDRIVYGHIRAVRAGETPEQARERADKEFAELQASPFFRVWASATVDEIISALHRRLLLGAV